MPLPKLPFLARLGAAIKKSVDLRDLFVFAGVALVAYGGNMIYPGAGWVASGAALFWIGARSV